LPNGPSNGLPGQLSVQPNQQLKMMSSRSASSTPPLSSMVNHPSRPGSAPPPATGAQLSSPVYPPSQPFGVHSSPSTPSGPMPTSNITGVQQEQNYMSGQNVSLSGVQPLTGGAFTQNFTATPNSRSAPNQSVRPSPWQASVAGTASPPSRLAAPPSRPPFAGPQTHMAGPPTSMTGPPTRVTGPPTSMTGPPTSMIGQPISMTGPPTSMIGQPISLTGQPTGMTGPPTRMTGPPTSLTGSPTSLTGPPTGMTGPPIGMTGPPIGMTGPPTSMIGQPTKLTGQPTRMTGPPTSLAGRPPTLTQPQIRPPSTTPTGQMMGSTGQPLMPPMPQSPSGGPPMSSQPGSKRRVYPSQVHTHE
jgi:hypothetical protein